MRTPDEPTIDALTARERDCLRRLGEGLTTAEVAAALGIARSTLDKHLGSARTKLGVRRTLEALLLYERHGRGGSPADRIAATIPIAERSASLSALATDLDACRTFAAAWSVLHRYAGELGGSAINFGLIAEPPGSMSNGGRLVAMSLPVELTRLYRDIGGARADPFLPMMAREGEGMRLNYATESLPRELRAVLPAPFQRFHTALHDHGIGSLLATVARDGATGAPYAAPYALEHAAARDARRHPQRHFEAQRCQQELFWEAVQRRRLLRDIVPLTPPQRRALGHAARGFTNAEGAERAGVSLRAFEKLLAKARAAFDAPTTAAAVYRATVYRALD